MPKRSRFRTQRDGPPEVWFRILHIAPDGNNVFAEADLIEQRVEIALGPKGAFENGSVGTFKRRVTADRIVNAAIKARRPARHVREPRPPHVIELLQKAQEWHRQLEAGEVRTQAEIAQREGITRARVTQVMSLLRLAQEIQEHVLSLPDMVRRPAITERALRPIAQLDDAAEQLARFERLFR